MYSSHAPSDSNILGIKNYRNAKYQGVIGENTDLPGSAGMVLDENYLLVVGRWKNGYVDGAVFVVYPDSSMFYGNIKDRKPFGFCCRQISQSFIIYFYGQQNGESYYIYQHYKTDCLYLFKNRRDNQQKHKQKRNNKKEVRDSISFKDQQQKWTIIQDFFKQKVSNQVRNYKLFIKHNFVTSIQPAILKLKLTQTKDSFQFGFTGSSIGCKISDSVENNNNFKIVCLGFYDQVADNMEIYKKNHHNAKIIQEYLDGEIFQYKMGNPRSIMCGKQLLKYYMSSVNFSNRFINLSYIYSIQREIDEFAKNTYSQNTQTYAQKILQKGQLNKNINMSSNNDTNNKETVNYNLVRQNYQRLSRSRSKKKQNQKINQLSRKIQSFNYTQQHDKSKSYEYQKYLEDDKNSFNQRKRSYNYLQKYQNQSQNKNYKPKVSPNYRQYSREQSPSKYQYLKQKSNHNQDYYPLSNFPQIRIPKDKKPSHNESISTMIKNYQDIKVRLQRQAQKNKIYKTPSKLALSRSPSISNVHSRQTSPSNQYSQSKQRNNWR